MYIYIPIYISIYIYIYIYVYIYINIQLYIYIYISQRDSSRGLMDACGSSQQAAKVMVDSVMPVHYRESQSGSLHKREFEARSVRRTSNLALLSPLRRLTVPISPGQEPGNRTLFGLFASSFEFRSLPMMVPLVFGLQNFA